MNEPCACGCNRTRGVIGWHYNSTGGAMTLTRLVLLIMLLFIVVFAVRVFLSGRK